MAEDKTAFLTNIRPEIQDTLSKRQASSSHEKSNWFRDRTPWVRLSSLVKVGSDAERRKQWILFSGTSQLNTDNDVVISQRFKQIYNNQLLRPFPGITKLHVENKSSYGSVREATINFNCWTLDQLDILEKLYMSLGMPLLVEWGWNKDINGNMITENMSLIKPTEISFYCIDKKIKNTVSKWGGNYDAMVGLVTDFGWSMTEDGGFDCSTTIVSPGDMYLSISTKTTSKQLYKATNSTVDNQTISENLEAAIFNVVRQLSADTSIKSPQINPMMR